MLKEKHQNYQDWNFTVAEPFFFFLFLSKYLFSSLLVSIPTPCWFLWLSIFFFLSFSFYSFFLDLITFTLVS
jgi:hypothetical protein